ncbi:MAG: glycosyltransferase [Planctomycetota bacterium]|nr:glycosyltransferase [Planctomycetota bacterium]
MRVLMLGWEFPPHISGGLGTACHGITQALTRAGVDVLFVVPRARGDEDAGQARVVGANQIPVEERQPLPARKVRSLRAEYVAVGAEGGVLATEVELAVEPTTGESVAALLRSTDRVPSSGTDAASTERFSPRLEPEDEGRARAVLDTRAIDSLLSPYLDARGYRALLLARARAERAAAEAEQRRISPDSSSAGALADPAASAGEPAGAPSLPAVAAGAELAIPPALPARRELRTWIEERDEPVPDRVTTRLLDFSGAYGGDLMGEVARYALAVESLARRETFDVVHAHDWMAVPAGVAAKRASGKKLVFHVHACEHDRAADRPDSRVKGIEQLGLDEADIVVCVSHYTAGVLKRHYRVDESKIRVVHNALTQRERREQVHVVKPLDEPIVLFLGRITSQKGPEYFLEAAVRVARVRPDVKFVVAGAGDRLGETIELAAKLGLARCTHFTGFLNGADVERMYAMADVYVMPSVSEPFGIAPLEAMALDVPVIVSRQSGVSEVLRSALKVDYWDVQGIAEKILAVLAYPDLSRQLQEEGKAEALAMRWDAPAAKLKDAYASLAGTA